MNSSDLWKIFNGVKIYSFIGPSSDSNGKNVKFPIFTLTDSFHGIFYQLKLFLTQKPILFLLCFYLSFYFSKPLFIKILKFYILIFLLEISMRFLRVFTHRNNEYYIRYFRTRKETLLEPNMKNFGKLTKFHTDFDSIPVSFAARKPRDFDIKNSNPIISFLIFLADFLVYPGSKFPITALFKSILHNFRERQIMADSVRFKIKTSFGNYVDSMYKKGKNGILVILSSGNCCFYETLMEGVIESDFSALGWNHLGFGCSTGRPTSPNECDAILSVIEFATNVLKYDFKNIIVYGWSIGTYTASYASKKYPSLRAIVLDAGFDSLVELSIRTLGNTLHDLMKPLIDIHYNLDVNANIKEYKGTVLVSIHDHDEVMCRGPPFTNVGINIIRSLVVRDLNDEQKMVLDLSNENIFNNLPILGDSNDNDKPNFILYIILKKYAVLQKSSTHGEIDLREILNLVEERVLALKDK